MSEDNKNLASNTERTSILPQSELQAVDQTEVLPIHASEAETAQMPPVAQEETGNAFAGTRLESVAEASADDQSDDEAVSARAATVEPASKKTSWGKRAAIAGAAAALLSVGFGAGIITHAAILGDGEDFYEQGYEDGYNDQGYGDEDEDWESNSGDQQDQNVGPGGGQPRPGTDQQGPGSQQGDTGSTRPGPPPEGGRGPGSTRSGGEDVSGQEFDTSAS
ncbi:hypothetical protein HMPREF1138_0405 [Actinomyces sp. ICM58]|uniref:hypothetical protein n=1 Tax=Actinomyces sp. ICM58 TaxID=1105030 RepID=UPI0002771858|nr:hypothetical protein [Actinomyces sp. ICM58]EJN52536.1 hypothetical protein HMPREF1138_0405 [Actinomyces sp. ICM58]